MPIVWLDRDEAESGDLPPVCLRCGDDATVTKTQNFSWYPGWVNVLILAGLIPWAVVALILTKKMRLKAPMCPRHAGHWFRFYLFAYGGSIGMLAVLVGGAALSASRDPDLKEAAPVVLVAAAVGLVVVVIAIAVWQLNTIRPTEITDDDMKLTGVCEEFREALREQRRADRDREDDRPRRRRGRYD